MGSAAAIAAHLIGARIRAQMQYRLSFVLQIAGSFLLSFTDFLAVIVIFFHLPQLNGWTLEEVALLYGTSYIIFKLADMAFGHLDQLGEYVQSGAFDMMLVRPLGALFQAITADFQLRHIGSVLQGLIIFAFALSRREIDWTLGRAVMMAVMPLSGVIIFASIWVIGVTSTFWTVRSIEALNAFTYGGNQLTSYPMHIYSGWLRRLFIFVIPLAFVNYFPSLYILDKPDLLDLPPVARFLSPVVALVLVMLAARVWGFGLRHYRSTGS